jgi:hypothetical protein
MMQRLTESTACVVPQGLQAILRGASRGDVVETKDLAEASDMATWPASLCSATWESALADSLRVDSSPANSQSRSLQMQVEE